MAKNLKVELPELVGPNDAAELLRVDPKTLLRWVKAGKIDSVKTIGGHHRYYLSEIRSIMDGQHASQQK